jgi:DNA invertase Pin-like site-specific DNA recombinase
MPRYGYARVSSTDQDCALQEARLRDAGCEVIRAERVSGTSRDGRDELARIMDFLHAGDELVVVKLDRLGRSTRDVLNLVHELEAKGAALTVLEPAFSTKDAAGPILVTVLGMVAEMERRFIRERQQAGIEAAKAKGVYKGRKPSVPVATVREMREAGQGPTAIAKALGISRMSVHRVLSGQE